jgi:8-oxo-dGTP diphosphatase
MLMIKPILATLAYVIHPDGQQVLMIHRNTRPDDLHAGKFNGIGGKLQRDEDVVACLRREILEEAGITVHKPVLKGTISWPGFGKNGEDWFGFIFLIKEWSGATGAGNQEGTLHWIKISDLLAAQIALWPGDKLFLPLVFSPDVRIFHGVMPYQDGVPTGWHCNGTRINGEEFNESEF